MQAPEQNATTSSPLVRLLHITDPHIRASDDGVLRGINVAESLREVCNHALANSGPFDAILLTGDLVQDEVPAAYRRLRTILSGLGLPVYCIPGNHDDPALMEAILAARPFHVCSDIDLGDWQIAMLNTHVSGEEHGHLREPELARLDRLLERARHALICLHHQPVPIGSRWLDELGLDNAPALLQLIGRHRCVRAVLWGHIHQEFRTEIDGVLYMASPSTCAQFRPRTDSFVLDDRPPGYRWLQLDADGNLTTAVCWAPIAQSPLEER